MPAVTRPSSTARRWKLAGRHAQDAEPLGRRDSQGREGQSDRPAARARVRAGQPRARRLRGRNAPPPTARAKLDKAIELAIDESLSKGITTFEDAGSPFATIDVLKKMADNHELRMRIWMMLRVPERTARPPSSTATASSARATISSPCAPSSAQIDGALGSRGAWLLEPYTDKPDSSGLNTDDPADIRKTAELAIQHGFQLCVHAIGDRANRETLNIFEDTFKAHPDKKDLRWRVEHAQHLSAADIPRFGTARRDRRHAGHPLHVATRPTCWCGWARSAPKKAPMSGRS